MALSLPRAARPPRADIVVAGVFLGLSLVQVAIAPIAAPLISVGVAVGATLPLAWRRTHPAAAALAMTAVWLIPTSGGFLLLGYVIAGLLFYSLGAYDPVLWRVVGVTALACAVSVVVTLLGPEIWQAAIGSVLALAGPAAAGRLVAHQRAQNERLRALTEELVKERRLAERLAVAEERSRIARELHDVIGHEVTVIALQADAAAAALAKAPERAAVPIEAIRRSAADALAEMRRVVGMLRAAGEEDLHPQPGLPDVPALVEQSRAAGAHVHLTFRPPAGPLPVSVELAAYRLVQEALTNARRHAPGAPVDVCVEADGAEVRVEVVNQRQVGTPSPRPPSSGFGLVGMRERVRMLGGRLEAGPTDGGGYALTARLPLDLPVTP